MTERKKMSLLYKISMGFVVGVVLGVAVPGVVPTLAPVGKIFISLLKMLIVPLVFSSIVVGTSSLGDVKVLGRVGIKIMVLYLLTTAFAVTLGLFFGNVIQPGAGMELSLTGVEFKMPEVPKMI
ncbi:MAG TPA: cation:dicarboxylase symporter family transporter, partial [Synergistaceae bacterium]|nr:cation:dicarboxylase symporter family transporter [Synergistaceae bacterium]